MGNLSVASDMAYITHNTNIFIIWMKALLENKITSALTHFVFWFSSTICSEFVAV